MPCLPRRIAYQARSQHLPAPFRCLLTGSGIEVIAPSTPTSSFGKVVSAKQTMRWSLLRTLTCSQCTSRPQRQHRLHTWGLHGQPWYCQCASDHVVLGYLPASTAHTETELTLHSVGWGGARRSRPLYRKGSELPVAL